MNGEWRAVAETVAGVDRDVVPTAVLHPRRCSSKARSCKAWFGVSRRLV